MRLADLKIVSQPLVLATSADVDRFEAEYWVKFPAGYREYVTELGEGVLSEFVRIYPPWRIEVELADWRERINRYWFWDEGAKVLPKPRALECIVIGDTTNGDEMVFHPGRTDALFVLPRHSDAIFPAGADLFAAVDWMCNSGKLSDPFDERNFEPFDSRKQAKGKKESAAVDPPGECLADLIAAAQRWAKRHKLQPRALRDFAKPSASYLSADQLKKTIDRQSLVFEPGKYEEPGFFAAVRLVDLKTGLEIGVSEFHDTGDSTGASFTPNHKNWERIKAEHTGR